MYRPQLAPPARRAAPARRPAPTTTRSLAASFANLSTSPTISPSSTPSPKKTTVTTTTLVKKTEVRKPVSAGDTKKTEVKRAAAAAPAHPGLVSCATCGRYFEPSRVTTHQSICQKTSRKKRKPFDPVKHRLEGTEAQAYVNKPVHSIQKPKTKVNKNTWRKKHEEFIMIVRAAREAQAHVARGGKLSDLPAMPALATDHLVPCPHCKRKFNQAAADRHIPKCANIASRPKPPPSAARATARASPNTRTPGQPQVASRTPRRS